MNKLLIQARIIVLHKILQDREDTDPAYLSEDLKELRHRVMYVHLRVEQTLQIILAKHVFRIEFKKKNAPIIVEHFGRIASIFDNMEFYSKIKAIEAINLLPKKLIGMISKINDHRKYFSHPATYQNKIREYKNPDKQLETLKELVEVLNELGKYILENKLVLED